MLLSLAVAAWGASPRQHSAPLARQTVYRAARHPYGGAPNDAIDLTWDPRPTGVVNGHGAHAAWTSRVASEMTGACVRACVRACVYACVCVSRSPFSQSLPRTALSGEPLGRRADATRVEIASGARSMRAEFDKLITDDATLLRFWHDHRGEEYRVALEGGAVSWVLRENQSLYQ